MRSLRSGSRKSSGVLSRLLEAEGEHDHPSRATAQRIGIAHASPLVQVGPVVTDQVSKAKIKA